MTPEGLTGDQQLYLALVLEHFRRTATWPVLHEIQRQMVRETQRSIDVLKVLDSFPVEAHPFTSHLHNPAVLNVRALLMCEGADEEVSDFVTVLQVCVEKYFGPDDEPTLKSSDLLVALGFDALRAEKVLALLQVEPSILSGGSRSKESWEYRVSDFAHHFQGIQSGEDYLKAREQLTSAGKRIRSEEQRAQSLPPMSVDDAGQRIRVLKERLVRVLSRDSKARYYDPTVVVPLFDEYEQITTVLAEHYSGRFGGVTKRDAPALSGTTDFEGRGYVTRGQVELLEDDVLDCIQLLGGAAEAPSAVRIEREGIFFAGQSFDALMHLRQLLEAATESITVVDRFASDAVLLELAAKRRDVAARILMSESQVTDRFKRALQAFRDQYRRIAVRTSDTFHDRFLFIDEDSYHFGASFKDLGKKGFMFSRIEEPAILGPLRTQLESVWSGARELT